MQFLTDRLYLRHFSKEDANDVFLYAKDGDVGPRAGWVPHKDIAETLSIIQTVLCVEECYAVCLKETNHVIGCIQLKDYHISDIARDEKECEVGYWLGKPYWGQGLIPEAGKILLHHAFDHLQMQTVWCCYYEGNEQSKRVMEKLGFSYHHTTPNIYLNNMQETRTGYVYSLTSEQWQKI